MAVGYLTRILKLSFLVTFFMGWFWGFKAHSELYLGLSHSTRFEKGFDGESYDRYGVMGGFFAYQWDTGSRFRILTDFIYSTQSEANRTLTLTVNRFELRPWLKFDIYQILGMVFFGEAGIGFKRDWVRSRIYESVRTERSDIESDFAFGTGVRYGLFEALEGEVESQYLLPNQNFREPLWNLTLRLSYLF